MVRGASTIANDLKRHFLIFEQPFELRSIRDFGQTGFDIAKLKQRFPEAYVCSQFSQYCERFSRLLHIESESALRLLHRTQSAKNLGELNTFLRTFMLDQPRTFAAADSLVDEFTELNAAHKAVLTARDQIAALVPAREMYGQWQQGQSAQVELSTLRDNLDVYTNRRRAGLLQTRVSELDAEILGRQGRVLQAQEVFDNENAHLRDLEEQHRQAGGTNIERWEEEKQTAESNLAVRLRKQRQVEIACENLGQPVPADPDAFGRLLEEVRQESESFQAGIEELEAQSQTAIVSKSQFETKFSEARAEVESLEKGRSNIPWKMLEMRAKIANAVGLNEETLPFVGELIEVKAEDAEWTGAIERVLHGFALSVVSDDRHSAEIARWVNPRDLGERLIHYKATTEDRVQVRVGGMNLLVQKLNIKEGPYTDWVREELRKRFNYVCVNLVGEFAHQDRAVTREGQIKHGPNRFEKDDRRPIGDRRNWILGFDSREKLAAWTKEAQRLAFEITDLDRQLRDLKDARTQKIHRVRSCESIINTTWAEIDARSLVERIATLEQMIRDAREGNSTLQMIADKIKPQRQAVGRAQEELVQARVMLDASRKAQEKCRSELDSLNATLALELNPHLAKALDERFALTQRELSLESLDPVARSVANRLTREIESLGQQIGALEKDTERIFHDFIRTWQVDGAGLQPIMASADDFFAKLARLESDNLPEYEERFFNLLRQQSQQHLVALSTYLRDERAEIREKMELVNESLNRVPFDRTPEGPTYLRIEMTDKISDDVRMFRQDISTALENCLTEEGAVDRALAEERFSVLSTKIVARLASQTPEDKRWRENVLDVRRHIEFMGREIDENGANVQIHRSGSGKSGGQRQKLATTCLAAALCYQLGGTLDGIPIYAPVILDEAFGKEDSDFTSVSLGIFKNFGFQVLIATPFQKVMTIEPFVGGACLVEINERQRSAVLTVPYSEEHKKLQFPTNKTEGVFA